MSTVIDLGAESVEVVEKSTARARTVAGPSAIEVESQVAAYGSVRSTETTLPLTRNSTRSMPSGSAAVPASVTYSRTSEPSAGEVKATVGGVGVTGALKAHRRTIGPVAPAKPSTAMS